MQTTSPVNIRELARRLRRLGVTVPWLRKEADAGRIPFLRIGRARVFDPSAVEAALARRAADTKAGDA